VERVRFDPREADLGEAPHGAVEILVDRVSNGVELY
jgi:hypothetical protein